MRRMLCVEINWGENALNIVILRTNYLEVTNLPSIKKNLHNTFGIQFRFILKAVFRSLSKLKLMSGCAKQMPEPTLEMLPPFVKCLATLGNRNRFTPRYSSSRLSEKFGRNQCCWNIGAHHAWRHISLPEVSSLRLVGVLGKFTEDLIFLQLPL